MIKKIIVLLILIGIIFCMLIFYKYNNINTNTFIKVAVVDSCEYVYGKTDNALSIIHKANCKFCEERRNLNK